MAGFINSYEAAVLDFIFGGGGGTIDPTNWFVALSTTTPAEDGTNFTEPVGNNYARESTGAADWNTAVAGNPSYITNANAVTFNQASGSWGTVTHFGLFTASSGGTPQMWGALAAPKAIDSGDTAEFAAAALSIKLGDPGDTY